MLQFQKFLESTKNSDENIHALFFTLLCSSIFTWIIANLLILDIEILAATLPIALACFSIIFICHGLSQITKNIPWSIIIIFTLIALIVYVDFLYWLWIYFALTFISIAIVIKFARVDKKLLFYIVLTALITAFLALGCEWYYTSLDIMQRLHSGTVSGDTLYHASLAAMIKNYHIQSSGLHGLVETPYHTFSHVLFAGISKIARTGVFETYGVASQVLFIPFMVFCIATCSSAISKSDAEHSLFTWSVIAIILLLIPYITSPWGQTHSFLVSESYMVALALFSLSLALLLKKRWSLCDGLLFIITSVFITHSKASVGIISLFLLFVRIIFLSEAKRQEFFIFCMAIACSSYFVIQNALANSGTTSIPEFDFPFSYIARYSMWGRYINRIGMDDLSLIETGKIIKLFVMSAFAIPLYFIFHYISNWILINQLRKKNPTLKITQLPAIVYSLAVIFVSVFALIFAGGIGGNVYYFTNVAFFTAIPFIAILYSDYLKRYPLWLLRLKINTSLKILFLILLVSFVFEFYGLALLAHTHQAIGKNKNILIEKLTSLRYTTPLSVVLKTDKASQQHNPHKVCWTQPFVYTAISERPWMDVIDTHKNCNYQYYGFSQYGLNPHSTDVTIQPVLMVKDSLNFKTYVLVEQFVSVIPAVPSK